MTKLTRRTILGGALGGFFAYAMRNGTDHALANQTQGKAERCVVLWMNGGPSQFETVDPKPGAATGGELKAIDTSIPGVRISETLPHIAKQIDKLSIVRNVTSTEGEHIRGQYYLHTGYSFVPGFPRPALGAVVAHESEPNEFPNYVSIGSRGYGPAYMGPEHSPFSIEDPERALDLMRSIRRRRRRISLLQDLGTDFDNEHPDEVLDRRRSMVSRIDRLVTTKFVNAVDLKKESKQVRARYGDSEFGRGCLLARRLLETGVSFVEVQSDGWDTHANNFAQTQELCERIDAPWSALIEDLGASGLLDETIVIWMGEFGRTPTINANRGRDHFPTVVPTVIGGGGLPGGQVIGQTNRSGREIEGDEYTVPDLFATIFAALGIDAAKQFTTSFASPTAATDSGQPISELSGSI